ncbi:MAG: hypothetical protein CMJ64_20810 [Planctomycetaceae bacterium]|nr:hypothetical protein [Planctomycetaceae bacterium]
MLCGYHNVWLMQRAALSLLILLLVVSSGFAQFAPGPSQPRQTLLPPSRNVQQALVADVRITGNETVEIDTVISYLRTRKDRTFDPERLQADKRSLASSGLFRDVRIYTQQTPQGMVVTFEVFERPTIRYILFHGNQGIGDRALLKQCGLEVGDPLNFYAIGEARRKIEDYYHTRGFPKAEVTVSEGNKAEHRGATFGVAEGPLQRISSVDFVGNSFVSDGRLKTQIKSKPGFLWYLFRGKVDESKIEGDVAQLTAYYKAFGFFKARISRHLIFDDHQKWLKIRFVIDEGPQFVVRNVSVVGNDTFNNLDLDRMLELKSGQFFNQGKMERDVSALRDVYGGQGFIFADVKAEPRFSFEEAGQLDLIYDVSEGDQFRVGRINVHIAGEFPHTRESVVHDRISIRPGDIVDIREVRNSERRLRASQLFEADPQSGKAPRIVIRPPDLNDAGRIAKQPTNGTVRGQSPDGQRIHRRPQWLDLDIYVQPAR